MTLDPRIKGIPSKISHGLSGTRVKSDINNYQRTTTTTGNLKVLTREIVRYFADHELLDMKTLASPKMPLRNPSVGTENC
jgi:hypothetical protein